MAQKINTLKETYNIISYEDFVDDQQNPFIARIIIGKQIREKEIYGFKLNPFFNLQNDDNGNQAYVSYGFATRVTINFTERSVSSKIENICTSYDLIDEEKPCLLNLVHEKVPVLFKRAENLKKDLDKSKNKKTDQEFTKYPEINKDIGLALEEKFIEKGNKVSLKDLRSRLSIKNPVIIINLIGKIPQGQKEIIEIPTEEYFNLIEAGEFEHKYSIISKFGGAI